MFGCEGYHMEFVAGTLEKNLVDFTVMFWQIFASVFTVNLRSPVDYLQEYSCMAGQIRAR